MGLLLMQNEEGLKQKILDSFQPALDGIENFPGASVLVAIYKRPTKTKGGVILTDQYRDEDIYQGKIGLVLKVGETPFDNKDEEYFGERKPQVGDWVMYRISDGMPFQFGNIEGDCRLLRDRRSILMIIKEPDIIW